MSEIVFNETVLQQLRNSTLDNEVTNIKFPSANGINSNSEYQIYIDNISEGLKVLAKYDNITELNFERLIRNVRDLAVGSQAHDAIVEYLSSSRSIHKISLDNNDLRAEQVIKIAKALKQNKTLQELSLNNNYAGDDGAKAIAEALSDNHTLISLSLANNYIKQAGSESFATALGRNNTLKTLNLSGQYIGDQAARVFAATMLNNNSLTNLELDYKFINRTIIAEITTAISDRKTREENAKRLEEERQAKIAQAIADKAIAEQRIGETFKDLQNNSITRIDLHDIKIGDVGAEAIATKLRNNNKVTEINLSNSNISDIGAIAIAVALEENKTLTSLNLQNNNISNGLITRINNAIKRNQIRENINNIVLHRPFINSNANSAVIKDITNYANYNGISLHEMMSQIKQEFGENTQAKIDDFVANIIDDFVANIIDDLYKYKEKSSIIARFLSNNFSLYDAVLNVANHNYKLKDIEILLEARNYNNKTPAMLALQQFINHSLISHLDYFLIQALKIEDLSKIKSDDYPNIKHIGNNPLLEHGVTRIVESQIIEPQLSFIKDSSAGTIRKRFERACRLVDGTLNKFNETISETRNKIIAIITEVPEREKVKQLTTEEIRQVNQFNEAVNSRIRALEQARDERRVLGNKTKENTDSMSQMSALIGINQLLNGVLNNNIESATSGILTLGNSAIRSLNVRSSISNELRLIAQKIKDEEQKFKEIGDLTSKLEAIAQEIEILRDNKQFQEQYLPALKQAAIKEAYIAKSILDNGATNLRRTENLCEENNFSSVDEWVASLEPRLAQAVTNFCFGYADSNDLKVIIADANAINGNGINNSEIILKTLTEDYIKEDISSYYAHASQVDKIYQAALTSLGTDFYEVRQMVQRSHDEMLIALYQYPQKTYPALMDEIYSARGALDVRRVFDYWQHRHGDMTVDNAPIRYERKIVNQENGTTQTEREPRKRFEKKVSVLPQEQHRSFVEAIKSSYVMGNESVPNVGNDYLRLCAYEYMRPQLTDRINIGANVSDEPATLASYPIINSTVNLFVKNMCFSGVDDYKSKVGNRLDNLIAQTFTDFFAEMGEKHARDNKVKLSVKNLLNAKTRPESGTFALTDHMLILEKDFHKQYELFLEIYARNLEKMLEVIRTGDRELLIEQIKKVHDVTKGQLASGDINLPGSEKARLHARSNNHTYENTNWKVGR